MSKEERDMIDRLTGALLNSAFNQNQELQKQLDKYKHLNRKQAKALEKKNRQLKALRKAQNFGEIVTVKIWEPTHFRTIPTNKDKSE